MAGIAPKAIVLAMGAGALGGPDALRLLLTFAGRSPLVDIVIAVFLIAAVTAPALGTMLLSRFFRKPRSGPGAAAGDLFAEMTLMVSLAVVLFVSASLLVVPFVEDGDLGPVSLMLAFAVAVFVGGASTARARARGTMHLSRFFRTDRTAHSASGAATSSPATARSTKMALLVSLAVVSCVTVFVLAATGFPDAQAQRYFVPFAEQGALIHVHVSVATATATAVGTALLARYFHEAHNASTAGGASASTRATERIAKMILAMVTTLSVVFFLVPRLLSIPSVPPGRDAHRANHACSS